MSDLEELARKYAEASERYRLLGTMNTPTKHEERLASLTEYNLAYASMMQAKVLLDTAAAEAKP